MKVNDQGRHPRARIDRIRKKLAGTPEPPRLAVFRSQAPHLRPGDRRRGGHDAGLRLLARQGRCGGRRSGRQRGGGQGGGHAHRRARAKEKGVEAVVFDRGGYLYHGRIKALADAAREGGLEVLRRGAMQNRMRSRRSTSRRPGLELKDQVVHINRVTKVVKGGKNLSFSALVVVGDGKGRVGYGLGKAKRGLLGHQEGRSRMAKKNMMQRAHHREGTTIPHTVDGRFGAGRVLLKPASEGTGVIAGGAGARGPRVGRHPGHPDQVPGLDQPAQRGEGHGGRAAAAEAAGARGAPARQAGPRGHHGGRSPRARRESARGRSRARRAPGRSKRRRRRRTGPRPPEMAKQRHRLGGHDQGSRSAA